MPLDLKGYSALSNAIFSAAVDRSRWHAVLGRVSDIVPGANLQVFGYEPNALEPFISCGHGYDPEWMRSFQEHYAAINPWARGVISQPAGKVLSAEEMCPQAEVLKTEFYADWLRPQGDIIRGGGGVIGRSDTAVGLIGANIEARAGEEAEAEWLGLLRTVMPLLQRAWDIGVRLSSGALERDLLEIGRGSHAVILASQDGRLRFATRQGRREIEKGEILRLCLDRRLRFASPLAEQAFIDLRSRLTMAPADRQLVVRSGGATVEVRMLPFNPDHLEGWGMSACLGLDVPSVALILSRPGENAKNPRQALVASFGLTRSEADIACLLADGHSLRDISELRATTYNTTRNQLKSLMEKLECHRQVEVVKLVLRLS